MSRFLFRQSARYLAICGACFLLAPGTSSSAPLDAMLDAEGAFWSLTRDAFLAAWKDKGFRWTSSAKETARAYKTPHTFMQQPVMEALVRFGENEPQSVDFVLYNRGDSGVVSEAVFEKAVKDIQAKLSEWSGKRPRACCATMAAIWSVLVGRVKEKPPVQGAGGHMRLIIGYNDKTSELLYSDSWGRGHESFACPSKTDVRYRVDSCVQR